jgi:acylphosphatase
MRQAHLLIYGLVQGVAFRYFIEDHAKRLGLSGWTRNTEGKVEAVFSGDENGIKTIIELCMKGPRAAKVDRVDVEWIDGEDFDDFEIRY